LAHRNEGHDADYLDLHGLHVDEAIEATKKKLELLKSGAIGHLEVVTGAGHHSESGKAAIRPAVEELLK
jgi:DNA-nicking Smr family endonuclease